MADSRLTAAVCATLLSLLPAGCSTAGPTPPSDAEQRAADYGPRPTRYHDRVVRLVRDLYADRGVVDVDTTRPKRAWYGREGGLTGEQDIRYGWQVSFRGARLGFVQLDDPVVEGAVFFRDDRIEAIADEDGLRFLDPGKSPAVSRRR